MQEGLRRSLLLPARSAELELTAGISSLAGPFARGEFLFRPIPNLATFVFGQWTPAESTAGVGAKLTIGGP